MCMMCSVLCTARVHQVDQRTWVRGLGCCVGQPMSSKCPAYTYSTRIAHYLY
jgi:hypothetical protein